MANIRPETEVRGSLQQIYTTLLCSYNIYYSAWVDYVNGSISGIAFLNFEVASSVVVRCRCLLTGKG